MTPWSYGRVVSQHAGAYAEWKVTCLDACLRLCAFRLTVRCVTPQRSEKGVKRFVLSWQLKSLLCSSALLTR